MTKFDIFTLNILVMIRVQSQFHKNLRHSDKSDIRKQNEKHSVKKLCITNENEKHMQEIENC